MDKGAMILKIIASTRRATDKEPTRSEMTPINGELVIIMY